MQNTYLSQLSFALCHRCVSKSLLTLASSKNGKTLWKVYNIKVLSEKKDPYIK